MPLPLDPRIDVLPPAQREIWRLLRPLSSLHFVLYGGTAVALHLGHRTSIDFDFFRTERLDKGELYEALPLLTGAAILQDEVDTLAVSVPMPSGPVRLSFFGGIRFGRVREPVQTVDGILLVASLDDLMSTKLKTILDRAEARDYRDLAAMLRGGVSLTLGLSAFKTMFKGEPATVLRALGWFGDVASLSEADQGVLRAARDAVGDLPDVEIQLGSLAGPGGLGDPIEGLVNAKREPR